MSPVHAFALVLVALQLGCGESETVVAPQRDTIILTQRYDNARSGQNLSESTLKVSNVNSARFGKLFARAVDDEIYAQPLYVPNVELGSSGARNVLYIATVNNSVYAFDADDSAASEPLWSVNLTADMPGVRPVKSADVGQYCGTYRDFNKNIGIVGTPVIDAASRTIYLVTRTKEGGRFVQRLHALDITTGAPRPNSPVDIRANVEGSGAGSSDGRLHFDPEIHNQRAALLLANGTVYISWAAHCDTGPYHGWILGYDAKTLEQVVAKVTTPDGKAGGIWQSNSGPSADTQGNIYLTVGNGTVTAPKGGRDYGSAFLKLSASGEVLDWFVPFNFEKLNRTDSDLGSAGVLLIPGTELLTSGGKEGKLYVLNRNDLGRFQPRSDEQVVQSIKVAADGLYGTPTYWNGPGGPYIYVWGSLDRGKAFRLRRGRLMTPPISQTRAVAEMPGGLLSVSALGETPGTGILWALVGTGDANQNLVPGVLHAFDATDLGRELWNSNQNPERDRLGLLAKFNTPIVANGKVYVATSSKQVVVYGLLSKGANPQ